MIEIFVPTMHANQASHEGLFLCFEKIRTSQAKQGIAIRFDKCENLHPNAIAYIGALARWVQYYGGKINFRFETASQSVLSNLQQAAFINKFSTLINFPKGNAVPYAEHRSLEEKDKLVDYLDREWLGRGWVNLSPKLKRSIIGIVTEIYANSFEHAGSLIGTVSCGRYYPNESRFRLTVIDLGVGVPKKVRDHLKMPDMSAGDALQWAFQRGNSTRQILRTGGMGLDLLKEFIRCNNGLLEIYSLNGYGMISKDKEEYLETRTTFNGTLVTLRLQSDEKSYYVFRDELIPKPNELF